KTNHVNAELSKSEAQYRLTLDSMGDPIHVVDSSLRFILFNKAFEKWVKETLGLNLEGISNQTVFELFPFLPDIVRQEYKTVFDTGQILVTEEETPVGNKTFITETRKIPIFENKKVIRVVTIVRDITARKRMEEDLKHHILFENLITRISTNFISIASDNVDTQIKIALKDIGEFTGVDRVYIFLTYANNTTADNAYEWCAPGIESCSKYFQSVSAKSYPWFAEKILNFEIINIEDINGIPDHAAGERNLFESLKLKNLICVPMISENSVIGFLGFHSLKETKWSENNIALLKIIANVFANALKHKQIEKEREMLNKELKKSNKRLRQMSLRDMETGLYNHKYLEAIIDAEFYRAKRFYHAISVAMIDIDYFKSVNDMYGYAFGDLVLKQFARQLRKTVRKYDIIVRFGGEEFVIISPGINRASAFLLAQRVLETINLCSFGDKKNKMKLQISAAIASYPEDAVIKGTDLIDITERLVRNAKENGGNSIYSSLDICQEKISRKEKNKENPETKFLKQKIQKLTKRENQGLVEAVFAFARTIELKDHYTGEHVERTVSYACAIARELNLPKQEIERIQQAAMLHDLGKIALSEQILLKNGPLNTEEYEQVKCHPKVGADILRPIQMLHDIIPLILYHHERWDGNGYPERLRKDEIPIGARIVALADVYQALVSDRPYRKAFSKEKAMQIIEEGAGTQFDPTVAAVFLEILRKSRD
ncbi:MAG: diguanylate cyclase, partial [Candidatus Omnitrophica bacterium]|nr:diguanylate cyclase [Candidatus Omnitrophota bacterium]